MLDEVRMSGKRLTVDGMYDLVLAATGSVEEAERAKVIDEHQIVAR